MSTWLLLLISAVVGSLISLLGGIYLLYAKKGALTIQRLAVPFAAGALLAATFFDLLPEALAGASDTNTVLTWTLLGFLIFFLLERFLRWFHHHHQHEGEADQANRSLIVIGDTLHNLIDGLAIGAAFLVNPATGIAVTVAIAAHEIPQEIGDFALLLKKGMSRRKVLIVNIVSALATVIGAVFVFGLGQQVTLPTELLLAATAGFFIYIAASDIIPTIHQQEDSRHGNVQAFVLLIGVVVVMIAATIAHSFIDASGAHGHSHGDHSHQEEYGHDNEEHHDHHDEEASHDHEVHQHDEHEHNADEHHDDHHHDDIE